jgi:hypothetical protein
LERESAEEMDACMRFKSLAKAFGLRYNEQNKNEEEKGAHTSRNTIWEEVLNGRLGAKAGSGRQEKDLWM